jgi:glucose-6-phosphate 1-dehydrogenase
MQPKPRPGDPCVLVIFGAAGDLTKRLLVPALGNLRRAGLLPKEFAVIGVSRRDMDNESFRRDLGLDLRKSADEPADGWLAERVYHLQGEFNDPAAYKNLAKLLAETDNTHRTGGNYLFYLATPAQVFAAIVQRLGHTGLVREEEGHWRRVIIEKPFGIDLPSAQALDRDILGVLDESQVYRIDHYLGKGVRFKVMRRFANRQRVGKWQRRHSASGCYWQFLRRPLKFACRFASRVITVASSEGNLKEAAVIETSRIAKVRSVSASLWIAPLGKETVQNILVFRFANGMFEPLWNRNHVDHVQITVAESLDVEGRGRFYDATGALRDMVPNHLFQLLTLTAMEPPTCFDAEAVRSEKAKVLEGVRTFGPEDAQRDIVRGQYGAGIIEGRKIVPYRRAVNVAPDSVTETYVALKIAIDSWRWAGVPFYLRTGKALAARRSEIAIQFKPAPFTLFRDTPVERLTPNDLILQIQPEEGMTLHFSAKIPGPNVNMDGVEMKFNYKDHFKAAANTGYETLIYDCMIGDATLFQRADNIEAGWRVVQPALEAWAKDGAAELPIYPAGSSGPSEADALLARDGRRWRPIDRVGAGSSS